MVTGSSSRASQAAGSASWRQPARDRNATRVIGMARMERGSMAGHHWRHGWPVSAGGRGGGGEPPRGSVAWSSLPAAQAAEEAAPGPPPDPVADRARGLLGHGFAHALATSGAEHRIPDGLGEAAAGLLFILGAAARLRRVRLLGEAFGLPGQDLERGFAIHRGVVLRTHRAAGAHALA